MIQGLSISPGGKFEKFGILHSGKDLRGDLITVYKHPKCRSQVNGVGSFWWRETVDQGALGRNWNTGSSMLMQRRISSLPGLMEQ